MSGVEGCELKEDKFLFGTKFVSTFPLLGVCANEARHARPVREMGSGLGAHAIEVKRVRRHPRKHLRFLSRIKQDQEHSQPGQIGSNISALPHSSEQRI